MQNDFSYSATRTGQIMRPTLNEDQKRRQVYLLDRRIRAAIHTDVLPCNGSSTI